MRKPDRWLTFLQVLKWIGFSQGVVFGMVAFGFGVNTVIFIGRSTTTMGTVVALEQHQDDDGAVSFPCRVVRDVACVVTLHFA